jgi:hypothetical protein
MKDAQKPDHVSLNTLIGRLKDGRYVIPDFQRDFEWRPSDIRELMRSIFLDYYIGSLLLWKGKKENFEALSCEALYGHSGEDNREYIVLDGQQRLTAMYYAFLAPDVPAPKRSNRFLYFVNVDKFMDEIYDEAFGYDWLTKRWSKVLKDQETQFANHIFPLSVIGAGGWDLGNWVQQYEQYWKEKDIAAKTAGNSDDAKQADHHASNAKSFGKLLKELTEQYQISYIELDRDLSVDKVCDIFTQINSRGIQLDVFDLMNALLKPKGLRLKHMWREAAQRFDFDIEKMNVYILQVMSILRQSYCSPKYLYFLLPGQQKQVRDPDGTRRKEVLVRDIADFETRWNNAVNAIERAIRLLGHPQEFGVIASNYLPYVTILPVFAALQAHVTDLPANRQLDAQRKIRHWYWASVFNNRYSGSVESTSARDFVDVKAWMEKDEAEPALIGEFATQFRTIDLRKETKRGTSVYNGIFNLLVIQGARDWMTGNVPQHGDLDDHHIVPESWGKKKVQGDLINSILNRTPLTADTNRKVISDRLPNAYLPELMAKSGESTIRAVFESHFISRAAFNILLRDPFGPDDFEAFVAERQRTLQEAIEYLLIKERLDLSPQLRELDSHIESVELSMRQVIAQTLGEQTILLPPHVLQRGDERIAQAVRKNGALDPEQFRLLSRKLEYLDWRDLQEVITNKALWDRFDARFANKDSLAVKFNQFAELRNGIRHSRTVDEVTRKEGEAAILWFNQVLSKPLQTAKREAQ